MKCAVDDAGEINVTVAWSGPAGQGEVSLRLAVPANVQIALDSARRVVPALALADSQCVSVGVWGKVRAGDYLLRDGDRVELYRALRADPKDARRVNAKRTPRTAGKM